MKRDDPGNYGTRSALLRTVPWYTAEETKSCPTNSAGGDFLQPASVMVHWGTGVSTHTNLGMNQTVCKHNQLLEITQGAISDLCNRHRYHSKHWSYWLPLHQPTLTGHLSNNTKDVKLIPHHQYKNMYHTSHMLRTTKLQETTYFHSTVLSTTCFGEFSHHHLVVDRQMHKRNWQSSPLQPLTTIPIDKIPFPIIIMTSSVWQQAYLTTCINISAQESCRSTTSVY